MSEQINQLQESARLHKQRIEEFEAKERTAPDMDKPMIKAALAHLRASLTGIGRKLKELGRG